MVFNSFHLISTITKPQAKYIIDINEYIDVIIVCFIFDSLLQNVFRCSSFSAAP